QVVGGQRQSIAAIPDHAAAPVANRRSDKNRRIGQRGQRCVTDRPGETAVVHGFSSFHLALSSAWFSTAHSKGTLFVPTLPWPALPTPIDSDPRDALDLIDETIVTRQLST